MVDVESMIKKIVNIQNRDQFLSELLSLLLEIDNNNLETVRNIMVKMTRLYQFSHNKEKLESINGLLAQLISDSLPIQRIDSLVKEAADVSMLSECFHRSFNRSGLVHGAIKLAARTTRLRPNDLSSYIHGWSKRLKNPDIDKYAKLISHFPLLKPVIFNKDIDLTDRRLENQYFGNWPFIEGLNSPKAKKLFDSACKRWPLQDMHVLSPVFGFNEKDQSDTLLFPDHIWPEHQSDLSQLRRKFPHIEIRFATLPELVYIDLCMRLGQGSSPFAVRRYNCAYPFNEKWCLTYSLQSVGVNKNQKDGVNYVLPLFIIDEK